MALRRQDGLSFEWLKFGRRLIVGPTPSRFSRRTATEEETVVVELVTASNLCSGRLRSTFASVVTIGAFDGVHLGHQALIRQAIATARREDMTSIVYTFSVPPKVFFGKAFALTSLDRRIERIASLGPDRLIVAEFDADYARRPASAFVEELRRLGARKLVVGADFVFGSCRSGNVELLSRHFETHVAPKVKCLEGHDVSSSRIRALRSRGQLAAAAALEGREVPA